MTTKSIVLTGQQAKEKLRRGANTLADAVEVTLGANGRNVVIQKGSMPPHVTKDGVTVAKSVTPDDPIEKIGALLIREASMKTADEAGDATTTATVLAKWMINWGLKEVSDGKNPVTIKHGIEQAVKFAIEKLKGFSRPCESLDTLINVATISANNDKSLGQVIAEVVGSTGKHGVVKIENSHTTETYGEVSNGMTIEKGWASPYFANNVKMEAVYRNPAILVCDLELTNVTPEFLNTMKMVITDSKRPLVIIGKEINGEFLQTMVLNKVKGDVPVVCIKAPSFGDVQKGIMEDICIATGGRIVSDELGLPIQNVTMSDLGSCDNITISSEKTVIVKGGGSEERITERVEQLTTLMNDSMNDRQKDMFKRRIANIRDGIGIIYVGAITDTELEEKKDRVDDAVHATQAAQEEGVIAGGGVTYLHVSNLISTEFENENIGSKIVQEALRMPFAQILYNSGCDNTDAMDKAVMKMPYGYGINAKTGEMVEMFNEGIIDPAKVARVALENAASVACLFLTTECVSCETEVNHGN